MKNITSKSKAHFVFRARSAGFRPLRRAPRPSPWPAGLLALFACTAPLVAADAAKPAGSLVDLSIEELMQIPVTSVAKREQKLSQAPAAIHVITAEDIRRAGATSLPEALRLAPGVSVARINGSRTAVGARGFNGPFANKLLVLVDGRSVYSPFFSGVLWETQNVVLEDIERIEIIRGPGATLWGANAVNGVINVITKSARDTQGGLVTGGGGNVEQGFGSLRYGAHPTEHLFYRAYVTGGSYDGLETSAGASAPDRSHLAQGGFRLDWLPPGPNALTLQGDYYQGRSREQVATNSFALGLTTLVDSLVAGGNVLGRWQHSGASDFTLQAYYDYTSRLQEPSTHFSLINHTADLEAQHRITLGERQELVYGAGYRFITDDVATGSLAAMSQPSHDRHNVNFFVQDELTLVPDRLRLTLGTKVEHNTFGGWDYEPGARLLYTPTARHTLWGSVARAVRTPTRFEHDGLITLGSSFFGPLNVVGNTGFRSEELLAYELGWRWQPLPRVSLDTAAFYNDYDRLSSVLPPAFPFGVPTGNAPLANQLHGETYGAEVAVNWQVTDTWRLGANYSWLKQHLFPEVAGLVTDPGAFSPESLFHVQSRLELPANLEFDTTASYADRIAAQNVSGYVRLDVRLGWRPTARFEASVAVQNLLDDRHPEFSPQFLTGATEIPRTYYGKLTWRF